MKLSLEGFLTGTMVSGFSRSCKSPVEAATFIESKSAKKSRAGVGSSGSDSGSGSGSVVIFYLMVDACSMASKSRTR